MKRNLQVPLLVVFAILLFIAPDAFAIDNCQICAGVVGGGGSFYLFCDRPSPGTLGGRYCFIEYDGGGGAYCHTEGDWCCVTGPSY
jgi:hypothetical protein